MNSNSPNKNPSKAVDDFLVPFAPEVRDLAMAARSFVLKMIPNIEEGVDIKGRIIGYSYGPKYIDMVCMIMPTKIGVNLGIAYAMQLPDPGKLLEGTGKVHRHVKLRSQSDLKSAALKSLLKASSDAAIKRREAAAKKSKK
ncbi:MAG TPA: DUF1801 domain-containing protein [Candidatus Angelobacter sp.]|nr:DUF1801 domain-containing protein [Candidatus Angelobacter sp.]